MHSKTKLKLSDIFLLEQPGFLLFPYDSNSDVICANVFCFINILYIILSYYCYFSSYNKSYSIHQNCAVKLIFNRRKYDTGLSGLFTTLHWLKLNERIIYKIMLFVHKCLYCQSPTYLNELLTPTYGFLRTGNLVCIKRNYSETNGAFSVCAPKLWNTLPTELKLEYSTTQFKRKLKTHLFNSY